MGKVIRIKGDFREQDLAQLEGYLKALIQEATGEPVRRIVFSGVVKSSFDASVDSITQLGN